MKLWKDRRGMAALEFAIMAQILALLFAGTADIGMALYKRFLLNGALSAATNYALVNGTLVSSAGGTGLATTLGTVIGSSVTTNYADAAIVVNNGPTQTITAGVATSSGATAPADLCYCPTGTPVAWGAAVTCGSPCTSGIRAGKFVTLSVSRLHTPLFSNYGFIQNGRITVSALVQVS